MALIGRLSFAFISLAIVFIYTSYGAEPPKQTKNSSANASRPEKKPVHLIIRSAAEIKQTFAYSPFPAIPSELEGYAGSQVGGTGTYRLTVDTQGAVTQVTILKGFTVAAVYDERFSNAKGNAVPALRQSDGSCTNALAGETGTDARRRYLLELRNTSVGDLWEIEWVTVIACNFNKGCCDLGWALSRGIQGANNLDCRRASRRWKAFRCACG